MKIKELIDEFDIYSDIEKTIDQWLQKEYGNLVLAINEKTETIELLHTGEGPEYHPNAVREIVGKLSRRLEVETSLRTEKLALAGWLEKIYEKHPEFADCEFDSIEELKKDKTFLNYLLELNFFYKIDEDESEEENE